MLETARLTLRLVRADDAPAMSRLMTEAVSRSLANWPMPFTPERAARRIADGIAQAKAGTGLLMGVERRADAAFLGCVWARLRADAPRKAGFGYWLGTQFQGQGYMREAARALCAEAFRRFDIDAIEAGSQPDNAASIAVLRGLGMEPAGEGMHFVPARGRDEHVLHFVVRRAASGPILGA